MASGLYPDYPDPMPTFQFIGQEGKGLLESALAEPRQTFGGLYLHRTVFDKAAALFRSIVLNHALVDGNKRLGLATVAVFLFLNDYLFYAPRGEAVTFALRLASPENRPSLEEVSRWLHRHSIKGASFAAMTPAQQAAWLGITSGDAEIQRGSGTLQRTASTGVRLLTGQIEKLARDVKELVQAYEIDRSQ